MIVDAYLTALYPIDFGGIASEIWRKTGIPLSMDKDNYSTLSIDLPNPPVVGMSPDDNYYYVFILTPRLDTVLMDWRQYELAIAASGLDDRFMLGPITAVRGSIGVQQQFRISRGNPNASMSASLEFSELDSPVREGSSRANRLTGSRSDDLINGNDGNDVILGGIGDDVLQGGNGNDRIIGGNDSDQLIGGAGDDSLNGGNGNDWLTGGSGRDTFIFSKGRDVITDYVAEEGDKIRINSKTFTSFDLIQVGDDVVPTAIIGPDREAKLTILDTTVDDIMIKTVPDLWLFDSDLRLLSAEDCQWH